jgi:hypothetical protein
LLKSCGKLTLLCAAAIWIPIATLGADHLCTDAEPRSGSIAVLDEEGRPVVPEELPVVGLEQMDRTASGDTEPLELRDAPGGGEMILLDERFRHFMHGRVRSSGSPAVHCEQQPPGIE